MSAFYHTLGIRVVDCNPRHFCSHADGRESFEVHAGDTVYLQGTPDEILAWTAQLNAAVTDLLYRQDVALADELEAITKEVER